MNIQVIRASLGLFLQTEIFWLHMDRDVRDIETEILPMLYCVCKPDGRAPLESIVTSRPLELVCIDFWSAED